jgi:hypothetical protein
MSALETPESPVTHPVSDVPAAGGAPIRPAWRESVTGQWQTVRRGLQTGARMVRHRPEHATSDPHAERVAAAGMGLLVLIGAVITYVAVAGGIDPLLRPAPAGGAPPAVVPSVTTTPTGGPQETAAPQETTGPEQAAPGPEPSPDRPPPPTTTQPPPKQPVPTAAPTPSPTPTPTTTSPAPSPSPSPSG